MYIKDLTCISPQNTFDDLLFEKATVNYTGNKYFSIEPQYKGLIPTGLLRRMGRAVRIGVGAGMLLLKNQEQTDGIIIGTANGGLEDCIKFLNQIKEYNEGNLTPTNFIQSTPNSVGGTLAIMSKNTNYNITHVHKGLAFENALVDAQMLFETGDAKQLLVGSIEEISDYNYNIDYLANQFKAEEIRSETLLSSNTPGTVCGEGAAMFLLSGSAENSKVKIADTQQGSNLSPIEIKDKITELINKNNLVINDIDALILGLNGDSRTDTYYQNIINDIFPGTGILSYKNIVGEYPTSAAFATWFGAKLMKGKTPPASTVYKPCNKPFRNILIYNHYQGVQHGFILLQMV